jgi:tetratricopeptide (TPR) repeat protein
MMKILLFVLFGAGLVMQGYGQTMMGESDAGISAPSGGGTADPDIGLEQVKGEKKTVNIFTNLAEGASAPAAASTNEFQKSRVGFLMSTGVEYADDGEYEQAENAYLRALAVDDQNPETIFRLAALYVNMERFREAAELFKMLTDRFPENPMAHNNLAWCYATGTEIRNTTLALRHAREALLYAPINPSIWNTLAEAYYVGGQYDEALRSAEYALELLQVTNPSKETIESFLAQREKIILARNAWRMLEGLDGDE